MKDQIRRLSPEGISKFQAYIANARSGLDVKPPFEILNDPAFSEDLSFAAEVDKHSFDSKRKFAKYLSSALGDMPPGSQYDRGLWTWLALYYFNQLCPKTKSDKRAVMEPVRYILDVSLSGGPGRKYYRHMVAMPFAAFKLYPESANLVLELPVNGLGEILEQICGRQEVLRTKALIEVADLLYFDKKELAPKRGATSRNRPGTITRLTKDVMMQFFLTYDLQSLATDDFIALLPEKEFSKWLPDSQ